MANLRQVQEQNERRLGLDQVDSMLNRSVPSENPEEIIQREAVATAEKAENKQQLIKGAGDILRNKDEAIKQTQDSQNRGEISKALSDEVKDDIRRNKVPERIVEGERKTDAGEDKSPKEGFLSTLALFLPAIIGGIGGAIAEGSEGAVAGISGGLSGAQAGVNLVEGLETTDLKQAKLKAEVEALEVKSKNGPKTSRAQQSNFTDVNGNPITFDPDKNQFVKIDGSLAKEGDFQDPISARQAKNLIRSDKRIKQTQLKLEHGIKKDSQLSDKQQDKLESMSAVTNSLDRVDVLSKEVSTGFVSGRLQSFSEIADAAPEAFTELKAETASLLSNYTKSISGAQVAQQEFVRLAAVIPSVNDGPIRFKSKLKAFRRIIEANKGAFRRSIETGQPLKMKTIKGLSAAEKDISDLKEAEAPLETKRKTKDGRIAIFDENKKFVRYE